LYGKWHNNKQQVFSSGSAAIAQIKQQAKQQVRLKVKQQINSSKCCSVSNTAKKQITGYLQNSCKIQQLQAVLKQKCKLQS